MCEAAVGSRVFRVCFVGRHVPIVPGDSYYAIVNEHYEFKMCGSLIVFKYEQCCAVCIYL